VSTPKEIAIEMLNRHLPVANAAGQQVPEAFAIHAKLLRKLEQIRMPGNALDLLISHFGVDQVIAC